MAKLEGQSIAASYEQLLHVDTDGGGAGATLVPVKDGDNGTTFCISMTDASTGKAVLAVDGSHASGTEVQIDNSATDGDAFLSFQLSGTSKFTMGVDDGDSDKFKIGTTAIGTGTMFALDTNSKISLSNNDGGNTGNTIFGKSAWNHPGDDDGSDYNTIVGELAMGTGTIDTAASNTAVGYQALTDITTGDTNSVVGSLAGASITTGHGNVFMGKSAGGATEDLGFSVIIGEEALGGGVATSAADGMVAIGKQAAYGITTGAANTAIGYFSMLQHLTGGYNTCLGYGSMQDTDADSNSLGSLSNTFIGQNAGGGTWGAGASNYNCTLGAGTLSGALTAALGNVAIGISAGNNLTGAGGAGQGSYNVLIGYDAQADDANGLNQIVIGKSATGQADNSVTLGNADVTAVYMAQDKGATVHCEDVRIGDAGGIGSATTADAIVIQSDGRVTIGASAASGANDVALQVQGYGTDRASINLQENHASFAASGNYAAVQVNVVRAATADYSFYSATSGDNADMEFSVGGTGIVVSDGGFNPDYAEYFESTDGSAIPIGTTVVLEEQKVRAATESEQPIGVIRPANSSTVVGGNAWNKWWLKHMRDDYGAYLWEEYTQTEWTDADGNKHSYQTDFIPADVTVPADAIVTSEDTEGAKLERRKLNPDYDATIEYVTREDRDEWNVVALLGQVPINKGQPTADNWIKMANTNMQGVASDTIEMWFVK